RDQPGCRCAARRSRSREQLERQALIVSAAVTSSNAPDFAAPAAEYFRDLQSRICAAFESFEAHSRFEHRNWSKPEGHRLQGGGESRLMRGQVFEKVGVNVS